MLFGKIFLLIQTLPSSSLTVWTKIFNKTCSQLRSARLGECINCDSEKYVAREKSSWQDTLSQCGNTETESWRNLSQLRQAFSNIFPPSGSAFCILFHACSVEGFKASSFDLSMLGKPAVDVNLICIMLRMMKAVMHECSLLGTS